MATPDRRLVLVLGPGRSGTSTMAGALAHSGYHVPTAIRGNETNPAGFFEPRWVVDFHRDLLGRSGVRTLDTEPDAFDRMAAVTGDAEVRAALTDWLRERLDESDRLVIKDPRLVWFHDLWVEVARDLGVDPAFVVMLRHPSEVSSSRSEYYNARQVTGVAGWVNVALLTERLTAGSPRAFVHYPRLTADWRPELERVREGLGLVLDPPPAQQPHPVDDFIDPDLRRMQPGWENVAAPAFLRDLADRTHATLSALAEDREVEGGDAGLDALRAEYAQLHADCLELVAGHVKRMRDEVQRRSARRARVKARQQAASRSPGEPRESAPSGVAGRVARKLRGKDA